MRHIFGILTAVVFTAGISVGITHSVMQEHMRHEINRVQVDTFNEGFTDGACHKGQDGFGHLCK